MLLAAKKKDIRNVKKDMFSSSKEAKINFQQLVRVIFLVKTNKSDMLSSSEETKIYFLAAHKNIFPRGEWGRVLLVTTRKKDMLFQQRRKKIFFQAKHTNDILDEFLKTSFPTRRETRQNASRIHTQMGFQVEFQEKMRRLDWNQNESRALLENKITPKKKVKLSKTQKNKPWTDKQTNIFAAVLSSTESRDTPFALVVEKMALKTPVNF